MMVLTPYVCVRIHPKETPRANVKPKMGCRKAVLQYMSKLLIFAASCCSLQQIFMNLTQQQYGIVQHIFLIMYAKFHDPSTKNTGFIKKKRIMTCFLGFGPIKMGPPGATTHFRVFFENFFTNLLGNRFS